MYKAYKSKLVLIHYSLFHTVKEKDLCANKKCGDVCATSHGMLMVMRYCQPDGSCDSNSAPQCETGDFCWRYSNMKILVESYSSGPLFNISLIINFRLSTVLYNGL